MTGFLTLILVAAGGVLAICAGYELVLALASVPWLLRGKRTTPSAIPVTRFLIVVPAHNEGEMIRGTVQSLLHADYPAALRDVVVVADNCTDGTAEQARLAGAICYERNDRTLPGKPRALHWIFTQVDLTPYGGVIVIDADTIVDARILRVMDARLVQGDDAIQAFYGVMNPDETWLTRLSLLPAVVKFYLNFPGKQALGLSCHLAGNGMCFRAEIIRRLGWNAFTLSEDWEYYLILVLNNYIVKSSTDAIIYGQVARSLGLGEAQRLRWMKGRSDALALHWRALLRKALRDRSLIPLDAIFDIARPTHAILMTSSLAYLAVCATLWAMGITGGGLVFLAGAVVASQVLYFLSGLAIQRPPLRTWLALLMIPWYLMWKFIVTAKGILTMRDRTWVKTTRN